MKKIISIVTPTYNEEENIERMVKEIEKVMHSLEEKYEYEHVVIDNNSKDKTVKEPIIKGRKYRIKKRLFLSCLNIN